jgi:glycosyltransferase involved in cell wall biosynthesis
VTHVSVIMPTLAAPERALSLERAIASVSAQEGVRARPIVVVNGPRPDPRVLDELGRDRRVRLLRLEEASIPEALRAGRSAVDAPWFGTLDDDDLLLPRALATRIAALEADPALDVVVTNGYRRRGGIDSLNTADGSSVRRDPLTALLAGNWLLPGSWTCRTARVDGSIFDLMPPHLECTYLAVRFALGGRMTFLDTPTVVWRAYGGDSISAPYRLGQPDALRQILRLDLPSRFRRGLGRRLAVAYHSVSELHRAEGRLGAAWRAHVRSLGFLAGWKYLPYTRHLLRAGFREARGRD